MSRRLEQRSRRPEHVEDARCDDYATAGCRLHHDCAIGDCISLVSGSLQGISTSFIALSILRISILEGSGVVSPQLNGIIGSAGESNSRYWSCAVFFQDHFEAPMTP
jgi:hypothetical protein